jgi:spermidine synthase
VLGNVAAALLGFVLVARRGGAPAESDVAQPGPPPADAARPSDRRLGFVALAVLAIGGAAAFALETTQFHLLAVVAGNSAYAFSLMLFAFLLGLGGGAAVSRRWLAAGRDAAIALGVCELLLAVALLVAVRRWDSLSAFFTRFAGWAPASTFGAREVIRFGVCLSALLPAALCIGAAYPLAMDCVGRAWPARKLHALGMASALNTMGNVGGAIAGGFLLLPRAGSLSTLHLLAATAAMLGALPALLLAGRSRRVLAGGFCAVAALFALQPRSFDWTRLASGANVYFSGASWGRVIDHLESIDGGLTTVHEVTEAGARVRTLLTNGKFQGNDSVGGEMVAQTAFALDPLLHTDSRRLALNIGFGTGTTARVLEEAGFERVDVVDLSADILRMADRWFRPVNDGVLSRARVRTHVADGRNFLLLSRDAYDVVSIEISSIWFAGAASLYNREFYQLVRAHLAPRGVLQQWVQLHHIAPEDVVSILETVRAEFPHAYLYEHGKQGIIVACEWNCAPSEAALARLASGPALQRTLATVQLDPRDLSSGLLLGPDELESFLAWSRSASPAPISTDDNLHLEYSTPRGNVRAEPVGYETTRALLARFSARTRSVRR